MKQIKSKLRVEEFGEVNTSEEEVNAMLDLVQQETDRMDSRFFEPACGDGNFLIEVLNRKLEVLVKNYKKNQYEFERNAIVVIGSIYGIDIIEDNAINARNRMNNKLLNIYEKYFKKNINKNFIKSVKFIIEKNIIHGDALTLKDILNNSPVIFCEWGIINSKIKRRDFALSELLAYSPFKEGNLFSDIGEDIFIPKPLKEHSLVDFDKTFETC